MFLIDDCFYSPILPDRNFGSKWQHWHYFLKDLSTLKKNRKHQSITKLLNNKPLIIRGIFKNSQLPDVSVNSSFRFEDSLMETVNRNAEVIHLTKKDKIIWKGLTHSLFYGVIKKILCFYSIRLVYSIYDCTHNLFIYI